MTRLEQCWTGEAKRVQDPSVRLKRFRPLVRQHVRATDCRASMPTSLLKLALRVRVSSWPSRSARSIRFPVRSNFDVLVMLCSVPSPLGSGLLRI